MYTFRHPYNNSSINDHYTVYYDQIFTNEELDKIIAYGEPLERTPLGLHGRAPDDSRVSANGSRLHCNDETRWLYERMEQKVQKLNAEDYQFDLTGFHEAFYYMRYDAPTSHFNWHYDNGFHSVAPRKLSVILQLSDPSEYEGGDLDIKMADHHITMPRQRGMLIAFPSWKIHRVTPVTHGKRRSLVAFVGGPHFR